MLGILILGLLVGCECGTKERAAQELSVPRLAPAAPPPAGLVPVPQRSPAPHRGVWGLELGTTDAAGIATWVKAQGLDCATTSSPRRMTQQLKCTMDALPPAVLGRQPGDATTQLLVARTDTGPLHHVSTIRRHDAVAAALADYSHARDGLTAHLGAPTRSDEKAPIATDLSGPHVRYATSWTYSDLTVQLTLSRMGGTALIVRERWDVPGVEAGVPPRPGSVGHSASRQVAPHSPHGIVPEQ